MDHTWKQHLYRSIVSLSLTVLFITNANAANQRIIVHDQAGNVLSSRTNNILKNLSYIDSLPFDGITLNIPATWTLLAPGNVANYNDIYGQWLAPLKGKLHKVTHNYVKIVTRLSADPFDDWTRTINNWVVLAEATRDSGLEGIWFDNEEYFEQMWNYPGDVKYRSKTLSQYQEQYRLRGHQVMQAIIAKWPAARIVHTHGPYASMSVTPKSVTMDQISGSNNDLRGYFFAGMLSAAPGLVVDGGEVYQYRSPSDFANSYNWRKMSMPNLSADTLIPVSLRGTWMSSDRIAFGTFDQQWRSSYPMNHYIFQSCVADALNRTDYIVWTYAESHNYLAPGGVSSDWVNAIWNGRRAAGVPNPGTTK
jgi:hypothetical protein